MPTPQEILASKAAAGANEALGRLVSQLEQKINAFTGSAFTESVQGHFSDEQLVQAEARMPGWKFERLGNSRSTTNIRISAK